MPKFSIVLGILGTAALSWTLLAQEPAEPRERKAERSIPRARPVELEDLEESVPRALPADPEDVPRAKPVTQTELDELARLRKLREEERKRNEEEAMRLKAEREEKRRKEALENGGTEKEMTADGEPVIPRAVPVGKVPGEPNPDVGEPVKPEGLSPEAVAAQRGPVMPDRPQEIPPRINASWETRTDARSFSLTIPAPRGQITDRWGQPLAQTMVKYRLAIKMPHSEGISETEVLRFARQRINTANRALGQNWEKSDAWILKHYENRRWLPMTFSSVLTTWQKETIESELDKGLVLFPLYVRHYPEESLAAHVLGYIGTVRKLKPEPVVSGDPLFEETEGREGLEKSFDVDLQGTPGRINYLFDSDGTELDREITRKAVPGGTIVTTIDLEMQQLAEKILAKGVRRGAFVVMDVRTGEILTMASFPTYDPNDWSPAISTEKFAELNNNPNLPQLARAFQGRYPPASTFKPITGLAALESGAITEQTEFDCPTVMMIDKRPFKNWNKKPEGMMNVVVALGRSCNPFFYKAGLRTGGETVSSMGYRFGLGQKTGIPLAGEDAGFMPSESNMREKGLNLSGGHLANVSIGQGELLATPLQVCQMMAGIANGVAIPEARLVRQVQDSGNRVTKHFPPREKNLLNVSKASLDTVRRGMVKVVNSSWGTGKSASNYYVTLAGKTGTGEWTGDRQLAWFAGFVPFEKPEYAFAVLYEGAEGETVGGGRLAAPMAGEFFNAVYKKKKDGGLLADYKKASSGNSKPRSSSGSPTNTPAATPVAQPAPSPEETTQRRTGFFKRFNNRR